MPEPMTAQRVYEATMPDGAAVRTTLWTDPDGHEHMALEAVDGSRDRCWRRLSEAAWTECDAI